MIHQRVLYVVMGSKCQGYVVYRGEDGANTNSTHLSNVINCVWDARLRPNVHWPQPDAGSVSWWTRTSRTLYNERISHVVCL
jgi:hypothetical protein